MAHIVERAAGALQAVDRDRVDSDSLGLESVADARALVDHLYPDGMMVRFTPNIRSVRSRVRLISRVRFSGVGWVSAERKARHPASAPAATSSARPTFRIPPSVIGCSTSNRSVNRVLTGAPVRRFVMHCV